MNEVGIKVIKGNEVKKIISSNNKITGVQLNNNNIINADNIICNADPPAVYEKLLDGVTMPEKGISQLVAVDLQKAESMVA